jgi:hypothetical protein
MIGSSAQATLRNFYRDVSTNWSVATTDTGTATRIAGKTGFTMFVQRVNIYIEAAGAVTYILRSEDDTVEIARVPASSTVGNLLTYDYGEEGKALPEGQGLEAAISGANNGLECHVEAYLRQTSPLPPSGL